MFAPVTLFGFWSPLSRQVILINHPLASVVCECQIVERLQIRLGAVVTASLLPQLKNPLGACTPGGWRKRGQVPGQLQLPDLSNR